MNRISNSKINVDDLNLNIEDIMSNQQLMVDSSLGFNIPIQGFGTKQAVTTKHQNTNNKLLTQNVQTILREAKREMLIDPNADQIEVGGDDLTGKGKKKKKFNFNGTQIIPLASNNFISQEQKLNVQYGISPKNSKEHVVIQSYNTNNYKSN